VARIIRKEAVYPYPPEAVWVALTDRHALAEWLMPNDFEPVVGRKFRFQIDPKAGCSTLTECELLAYDPPRRMVWSWVMVPKKPNAPRHKPMTITWTLQPEGEGTRLVLEHAGAEAIDWVSRFGMNMGWGIMVKRWILRVVGNVHDGRFTPGAIPLHKRCYKVKTLSKDFTW